MKLSIKENETLYDVIICGGGPSGCAAAAAAARLGAKTLLLEAQSMLGGMQTAGLVTCFAPFGDGEKSISRGIADEVRRRSNLAAMDTKEEDIGWVTASPEDNKLIYDDLVASSGAEILFRTTVCAVEREGSRITGIITSGKDGLTAYRAKTFIDCTGDADLCFFAGLEFEKGDTDGSLQAATLCFIITGINPDAYAKLTMYGGSEKSPIHRILSSGKWPLIKDGHFLVDVLAPGTIGFNAGHLWDSDGTDPVQFTKSMLLGRKLAREFRDALAELESEAFGESYLVLTAPTLGVRETRRIRGEYTLTLDDYIARRTFGDEIARNCYFIDLHSSDPTADSHTEDAKYAHCQYQPGESHGIPYRCLIPQGMDNLLVAGRSISCDRAVMGSIRVMPNCLTTGEAAGTAAALAVQQGTDTKHLDISLLRNTLRQNGAYFL
ncbi:MAG: FAD-dependent oxidoreductase [Ruminococcaceae bacterium]|nr:FAD-dependent oxidoreductase [Oscillospiraceae bacterium]